MERIRHLCLIVLVLVGTMAGFSLLGKTAVGSVGPIQVTFQQGDCFWRETQKMLVCRIDPAESLENIFLVTNLNKEKVPVEITVTEEGSEDLRFSVRPSRFQLEGGEEKKVRLMIVADGGCVPGKTEVMLYCKVMAELFQVYIPFAIKNSPLK